MENLPYDQAVRIPALAALMHRFAWASEYYAVAHPSLPNYLALTSGSTWNIRSDCWFCYVPGPDLATELSRQHISWAAYLEGLPAAGWLGPYWPFTGYAGKHDPWRYYLDVRRAPALRRHLVPLRVFSHILATDAQALPRLLWITPNLCHDGHDCPAGVAARWLISFVASVQHSPLWRHGTVLFVTWDEGSGADDRAVRPFGRIVPSGGGGHVLTLVISPDLPPGLHVATPLNHYSLLKTIEEIFHLPLLGATSTPGLTSLAVFWRQAARAREDTANAGGKLTSSGKGRGVDGSRG